MAVKPPVGHVQCPECSNPDAEVKQDKNGDHYRYCGICNAQYFTRGDEVRERNLLAKMRPIATNTPPASVKGEPGGGGEQERASDAPREVTPPPPAPKPKRAGLLLG